jgi:hypothetical protein
VSYCPAILPGDPQCPFYQQVLVVEELLDLLPNFLIATDRKKYQQGRSSHQYSNFAVPRIQVSLWSNTAGGNIPPPTAFGHS